MKKCPYCNKEISDELAICLYCNEKIDISQKDKIPKKDRRILKFLNLRYLTIFLIATTIVVAAFLLFNHFYQRHKKRFLNEAKAYLELGDKQSTIPLLLKHLLINPKDNKTKMTYANLLRETGELEKAFEIYMAILKSAYKKKEEFILLLMDVEVDILLAELKKKYFNFAEKALTSSNYEEARTHYKKVSEYIKKSIEIKDISDKFSRKFLSLLNAYEELVAKYAFSYLLEGGHDKYRYGLDFSGFEEILIFQLETDDDFWDNAKKQKNFYAYDRYFQFALLLNGHASKQFQRKNWDSSIEAYKKASEYFEKSKSLSLGIAAECLYNCAMSYRNKGNFMSSRKILNELKSKYPKYYNIEKVNQVIKEAGQASLMNEAAKYRKEASKYFDEKHWIDARVSFMTQIETLLKAGEPDNSELIGESRLNIYATYYNEHNYKKAKEMLLEIQKKNPNYNPILIKEYLQQVEELIKPFEK